MSTSLYSTNNSVSRSRAGMGGHWLLLEKRCHSVVKGISQERTSTIKRNRTVLQGMEMRPTGKRIAF